MELTKFAKIRYNPTELYLFDMFPKNGRRFNCNDVVQMRQSLGKWDVKSPHKNAATVMSILIDKIVANKEPFRIYKDDKRTGHHRVEYWLEPFGRQPKANSR